ncbi:MAG: DUF6198 family protein [Prevotellaceae bacterium]|nr:DUF6198 family protein [Prevotellaceae bacterium]
MQGSVIRKYILLFVSLFVNAFGIVFITKAALGTSPISGVPYVMSLATPLTFGTTTFIWNMLFMATEMALMGKRAVCEKKIELLWQIPIVFVFSSCIDVSMYIMHAYAPKTYLEMVLSLIVGCAILATGIGWAVKADVTMNPGEYLVKVIGRRFQHPFGNVKLCFDSVLVVMAIVLSLLFLHKIKGIGEGTIISALLVGPMERMFTPLWHLFDGWLQPKAKAHAG